MINAIHSRFIVHFIIYLRMYVPAYSVELVGNVGGSSGLRQNEDFLITEYVRLLCSAAIAQACGEIDVENDFLRDVPETSSIAQTVAYYCNFLPPARAVEVYGGEFLARYVPAASPADALYVVEKCAEVYSPWRNSFLTSTSWYTGLSRD